MGDSMDTEEVGTQFRRARSIILAARGQGCSRLDARAATSRARGARLEVGGHRSVFGWPSNCDRFQLKTRFLLGGHGVTWPKTTWAPKVRHVGSPLWHEVVEQWYSLWVRRRVGDGEVSWIPPESLQSKATGAYWQVGGCVPLSDPLTGWD